MLVLMRKVNEVVCIGNDVEVIVLAVKGNTVRIGMHPAMSRLIVKRLPSASVVIAGPLATFHSFMEVPGLAHRLNLAVQDACPPSARILSIGRDLAVRPAAPSPTAAPFPARH
jgi:hypothetical protein